MPENFPTPEPIEAFTIPEGSILLDAKDLIDPRSFAIAGLKKILIEREIDLPLGPELDLDNPNRLVSLNRFAVQIVTAGINADEITVPMNHWYRNGAAPQLLLACHVDDENNLVWFSGVLTGPEFKKAISNQIGRKNEITISTNEFQGGIDRLLRFVRILETDAIPRMALNEQAQTQSFFEPIKKTLQSGLSVAVFAAGAIIFGPGIFSPKTIGNLAMISGDLVSAGGGLRSRSVERKQICLLTPELLPIDSNNSTSLRVAEISIDRPIIFSLEPLNEITIFRNGVKEWEKEGTPEKRIQGPIPWPLQGIKPEEEIKLVLRPKGSPIGENIEIILKGNAKSNFQQLNNLITKLGSNRSEWEKIITQKQKEDRTLALTLLFSQEAPKSKRLSNTITALKNRKECQ